MVSFRLNFMRRSDPQRVTGGNAKYADKRIDIEAFAASIEAHGLLENLTAVAREGGRFAVTTVSCSSKMAISYIVLPIRVSMRHATKR